LACAVGRYNFFDNYTFHTQLHHEHRLDNYLSYVQRYDQVPHAPQAVVPLFQAMEDAEFAGSKAISLPIDKKGFPNFGEISLLCHQ
jgi:hypothetical protein